MAKRAIQFFLLRYAPLLTGTNFVNIGLIVVEEPSSSTGFCGVRFLRDWRPVRKADPKADLRLLNALKHDIQVQLQGPNREEMLGIMRNSFSNNLQVSEWTECLTDDPSRELELLASRYLRGARE